MGNENARDPLPTNEMLKDPIVEEIRAIREQIAAECHFDLHEIYERGCEVLKRWPGKVVGLEEVRRKSPPPTPPDQ